MNIITESHEDRVTVIVLPGTPPQLRLEGVRAWPSSGHAEPLDAAYCMAVLAEIIKAAAVASASQQQAKPILASGLVVARA